MANPDTDAIATDIEEPSPAELAPALTMAYGLTKREQVLTGLVCRGPATAEIADRRLIIPDTIDGHLKSIFRQDGCQHPARDRCSDPPRESACRGR